MEITVERVLGRDEVEGWLVVCRAAGVEAWFHGPLARRSAMEYAVWLETRPEVELVGGKWWSLANQGWVRYPDRG